MKCIKSVQEAYGDRNTYEVDPSELVTRPYCNMPGGTPEMRDAVLVGSYANGEPKYDFVTIPKDGGVITIEVWSSIGD